MMSSRRARAARFNFWYFTITIGAVLCALMFGSGCTGKSEAAAMPAVPVNLYRVENRIYEESTELMAQVNSKHATEIHPQVSGRIVRVFVTDGQLVEKGQPLYQLDSSQQAASVQSLAAIRNASREEPGLLQKNIESLQADLSAARADLDYSRKQLARYQSLLDEQTVSARDTEQYQTTVLTQEQKIKGIQANIASLYARKKEAIANVGRDTAILKSASANLSYYTVRAPFTGTVGTLLAKEGDVVDPASTLTTLTDNRNLEIDVAVSADDRSRIHLGTTLQLLTMQDESLGDIQVDYISPNVDPSTQTFLLKAKTINTRDALAMDQHLKARLIWGERQAILVPLVSVFRIDGQPFVYRQEIVKNKDREKVARMQAIRLGPIIGENVVVLSGLKPGDVIVESGIQKLQEGTPIAQAPPEAAPVSNQSTSQQE